jgi:hypothetical protein
MLSAIQLDHGHSPMATITRTPSSSSLEKATLEAAPSSNPLNYKPKYSVLYKTLSPRAGLSSFADGVLRDAAMNTLSCSAVSPVMGKVRRRESDHPNKTQLLGNISETATETSSIVDTVGVQEVTGTLLPDICTSPSLHRRVNLEQDEMDLLRSLPSRSDYSLQLSAIGNAYTTPAPNMSSSRLGSPATLVDPSSSDTQRAPSPEPILLSTPAKLPCRPTQGTSFGRLLHVYLD